MPPRLALAALLTLWSAAPLPAQTQGQWPGRVIVCGGGSLPRSVFLRCLAGNAGRVLIVPTAHPDPAHAALEVSRNFKKAGARSTEVISQDPQEAVRQLKRSDVLWFVGGDQSLITQAYRGTEVLEAMRQRNRQGMVVAGTSAGASAIGDLMPTGGGDPKLINSAGNPRVIDPKAVETAPGLGFLPGVIVDQHFIVRNRFNRLASLALGQPDHVGIGVDAGSAAEFKGNDFTMIAGRAAFFEGGRPYEAYMLQKGGRYKISGRELRIIAVPAPYCSASLGATKVTERSKFSNAR